MEGDKKEKLPPDDYRRRCKRSDGRTWRCKKPAIAGKSYCDSHVYRSAKKPPKIQDNYISIPQTSCKPSRVGPLGCEGSRDVPALPDINVPAREEGMVARDGPTVLGGVEPDTAREVVAVGPVGCEASRDALAIPGVNVAREVGPIVGAVSRDVPGIPSGSVGIEPDTARESVTVATLGCEVSHDVPAFPTGSVGIEIETAREGVKVGRDSVRLARENVRLARENVRVAPLACVVSRDVPAFPSDSVRIEPDRARDWAKVAPRKEIRVIPRDEDRCARAESMVFARTVEVYRCPREVVEGHSMCQMHLSITPKGPTSTMQGPQVKKPAVVDKTDIPTVHRPHMRWPNVVADAVESGAMQAPQVKEPAVVDKTDIPTVHRPQMKRPNVVADAVESGAMQAPQVKEPAVVDKTGIPTVHRPRMKRPNVVADAVECGAMQVPQVKKTGFNDSVEEEWRCKRTDGRAWRCKRRVSDGKTMCELHYEQGKLRQKRITVPESMKLQRGDVGGGDRIERKLKRKRALQMLENNSDKGMKRMKADLIRVFLRREIIELNKKSEMDNSNNFGEITLDLPYGLMAIPPPPSKQILENVECLGIKVGVNCDNSLVKRRFRSKNIEPLPVGPLKVVPFAGNVRKAENGGARRKCHWCQDNDKSSLTKCLSCRKRFFCARCIKERLADPEDVKVKCPACRGSCDCMGCCKTQTKEILEDTFKGSKFHQLQYLIKLLLPILERINQEQSIETEAEARFKGLDLSEVEIRQAEVGFRDQCCCNNCKSPILDFHRSCPNCSYNLCLSCCREYSQGECLRGIENSVSQPPNDMKAHLPGLRICSEKILKGISAHTTGNADLAAAASLSDSTPCLHISCPPMEFGGCDNSLLDLRCIFPLNWTKELEISAKESASGHEFPQATDDSLHCSLCASATQAAHKNKETLEASRRTQSHDNFIYCPSSSDDHYNVLAHFQKHWRIGHPVIVRNVLQCASALSLDPMAIFCSRLEDNPNNCVNKENGGEFVNCTDWYEVKIGIRESFARSLEGGSAHRRHKTLRVMAKLSSTFSQKLLEDHYSQIIHALPLQEYTNPKPGLLNIAGKLPEEYPKYKLDPHVCISFGSREVVAQGELVTKLHYNAYDMVNILTHVANATCSTEQLNKVSLLIRQNNKEDLRSHNRENDETRTQDKISGEVGGQDQFSEVIALGNGVIGDKLHAKLQSSDNDSDTSAGCSGTSDGQHKSSDQMYCLEERLESSGLSDKKASSELCGARWDVFRRQDVPKLLEYIKKYVEELSFSCDSPKNVVHPIFDGSFYLDSTHKMQLKEEFDIEPWTFNQCLGEAVFVPAGCPYQIRNVKSCVNIASGFISPENASECIKLINDIRTLPNNHKAKEGKLQVEKMTICSIDEAIKELYRLKSEEISPLDKGDQILISNS